MDRSRLHETGRLDFAEFLAAGMSPVGLEQLRLDRLLELRAVIDSLRHEHGRSSVPEAWSVRNRDNS